LPADHPSGRLVVVVGTGTEVGKTWVSARLLTALSAAGVTVAARKPAQSFDEDDPPGTTDAEVLAAATGEAPYDVCPAEQWYEVAMAPPMAAAVLERPVPTLADLLDPISFDGAEVGLVETAGGVRSPMAADADALDVVRALAPDVVVLIADAGLGTLNGVRLSVAALEPVVGDARLLVVLNRFDAADVLHAANRRWLEARDGLTVFVTPSEEGDIVAALLR
jgi:dethiobiotin synthetase